MGEIRKFLGFDTYDIGYRESYFKDMAKQGFILKKMGKFFATFEKGEPIDTEYRIKVLGNPHDDEYEDEDRSWWDRASEIASLGWINVGAWGMCCVFRCVDVDNFEEPSFTDEEYRKIKKKFKLLFLLLLTSLITLGPLVLQLFGHHILYERIVTILMWALIATLAWCIYKDISFFILLRQYKKHYIEHDKDWETVRRTRRVANWALVFIILMGTLFISYLPFADKTYSMSEEFNIDAPVLRLSDIDNGQTRPTDEDYILVTSSALAPFRYELCESDLNTGNRLEVKYYKLSLKYLSEGLKDEFTDYWGDLNDHDNIKYHSDKFEYIDVGTLCGRVAYIEDGNVVIYIKYQGTQSEDKFISAIEQAFGE